MAKKKVMDLTDTLGKNQNFRILMSLVAIMAIIKIYDLILDPNRIYNGRNAVFPLNELIAVFVFGIVGLMMYHRLGLPGFIKGLNKGRVLLLSFTTGLGFAIIFVIFDSFARIGDMSVGLPTGMFFYLWGAISTEVIMRLFAFSFLAYIIGVLFMKGKHEDRVFSVVASIISLISAIMMILAFFNPITGLNNPGNIMLGILGILVFVSELYAFSLFKKYGLVSTLIYRIGFYLVWHILWPIVAYS